MPTTPSSSKCFKWDHINSNYLSPMVQNTTPLHRKEGGRGWGASEKGVGGGQGLLEDRGEGLGGDIGDNRGVWGHTVTSPNLLQQWSHHKKCGVYTSTTSSEWNPGHSIQHEEAGRLTPHKSVTPHRTPALCEFTANTSQASTGNQSVTGVSVQDQDQGQGHNCLQRAAQSLVRVCR